MGETYIEQSEAWIEDFGVMKETSRS
jgi:hypothetical protein